MILIGKKLVAENYPSWIERRLNTYSNSCGLTELDGMAEAVPSQEMCLAVYTFICPKHEIRRVLFNNIRNLSIEKTPYYHSARASLRMLRGAELGNLTLCLRYILLENPILLAWQELAKYSPDLVAAIKRYRNLGEDAPYAKFLYTPDQIPEFTSDRLAIMAHIARAIAIREGNSSLQHFKGTDNARVKRERWK